MLGMHRSGTSAVARVLALLGARLGSEMIPPGDDNPEGFWEHAEAVRINEALLAGLGMAWDDPRPMPEGWLETPAALAAERGIAALVDREFAAPGLWALKDPRLCRLFPLWRRVVEKAGVAPRALLVVRNAVEVAQSLERRNALPRPVGELLWARHLIEAEAASRGLPRAVVGYDALLAGWRDAMARISGDIQVELDCDGATAAAIDDYLRPQLRHHHARDDTALPGKLVAPVAASLQDASGAALASAVGAQAAGLEERLGPAGAVVDGLASMLVRARRESADTATHSRIVQLQEELSGATAWAASLQAELEALGDQYRRVEADRDEKIAWARATESNLAEAGSRIVQLQEELSGAVSWAGSLRDDAEKLGELYRRLETDRDEKIAWARSLEQELQGARRAHGEVSAEAARLAVEVERMKVEEMAMERLGRQILEEFDALRGEMARRSDADLQAREEAEGQAATLMATLEDVHATLASVRAEMDGLRESRDEIQCKLDARREHAEALERDLQAVLGSRSWHITAPLRWLIARLTGRGDGIAMPKLRTDASGAARPAVPSPDAGPDPLAGVAFEDVGSPLVSVVIPAYGKLDYTAACLRSLHVLPDRATREVIVIE
ncbi:MAG TPA: hypothetical protein VL118_09985, partial [Luteimonas sp.]|nr:hypothetical protein [Luteimonas sp.]